MRDVAEGTTELRDWIGASMGRSGVEPARKPVGFGLVEEVRLEEDEG